MRGKTNEEGERKKNMIRKEMKGKRKEKKGKGREKEKNRYNERKNERR